MSDLPLIGPRSNNVLPADWPQEAAANQRKLSEVKEITLWSNDQVRLHCGELSPNEMRAVRAVLNLIKRHVA